ncbi:ABC-2 type transport system ATP-binding protein [Pseudonocardia eucalypti]|nr:ABC-2 type transport system ATP-binding protein [Pseudonocardia eucalypti]
MNGGGNDGGQNSAGDGTGRIVARNLSKRFGPVQAVRDLSFVVEPGLVTGFLGPNGAGKTTTLRAVLGLVTPTEGEVTINGVPYTRLERPGTVVGAVLDSNGFHRSRKARAHLRMYCAAIGVPDARADEVLTLVGLSDAANRKVGGFSLGMKQRLALATALLGDPKVLILDEPGAGLDPEGVAWLRGFLRSFAAGGRTVLVSSHQLAEISQTVDQVIIISQGSRVFGGPLEALRVHQGDRVHVECADPAKLAAALAERGFADIQSGSDGRLTVTGVPRTVVGDAALAAGVAIYGLTQEEADLERHFLELTSGQYRPVDEPLDRAMPGMAEVLGLPGTDTPNAAPSHSGPGQSGTTAPGQAAPGQSGTAGPGALGPGHAGPAAPGQSGSDASGQSSADESEPSPFARPAGRSPFEQSAPGTPPGRDEPPSNHDAPDRSASGQPVSGQEGAR